VDCGNFFIVCIISLPCVKLTRQRNVHSFFKLIHLVCRALNTARQSAFAVRATESARQIFFTVQKGVVWLLPCVCCSWSVSRSVPYGAASPLYLTICVALAHVLPCRRVCIDCTRPEGGPFLPPIPIWLSKLAEREAGTLHAATHAMEFTIRRVEAPPTFALLAPLWAAIAGCVRSKPERTVLGTLCISRNIRFYVIDFDSKNMLKGE
jgi:hypothetical protein